MAWRTVLLTQKAKLRIEHACLVIEQEDKASIPLEDIATLIIESPEVGLSSGTIYRLAQSEAAVICCDEKHMPSALTLPAVGNCRMVGMQRQQLAGSIPFKKRCWQTLVKQKINNQAQCLRLQGDVNAAKDLEQLAQTVASGDSGNVEAVAARMHFSALFGPMFYRGANDSTNAALDYGYAVMRAVVARALAGSGLLLSQGIHHKSELNPFNLADDFIEPFRPMVDLKVAQMRPLGEFLERDDRIALVELLGCSMLVDGQKQGLIRTAALVASSFAKAIRQKDPNLLVLPELLPITNHAYE